MHIHALPWLDSCGFVVKMWCSAIPLGFGDKAASMFKSSLILQVQTQNSHCLHAPLKNIWSVLLQKCCILFIKFWARWNLVWFSKNILVFTSTGISRQQPGSWSIWSHEVVWALLCILAGQGCHAKLFPFVQRIHIKNQLTDWIWKAEFFGLENSNTFFPPSGAEKTRALFNTHN